MRAVRPVRKVIGSSEGSGLKRSPRVEVLILSSSPSGTNPFLEGQTVQPHGPSHVFPETVILFAIQTTSSDHQM